MTINVLKDWANQNQGFLVIILSVVSLVIGWITGFFKWLIGKLDSGTANVNSSRDITTGGDSTKVQAGGDIVLNVGNTVALYSIEEVSKQLMGSVFGEFSDETKKQIDTNQKSYFRALSENLERVVKQNEELKKVVDSPDFQFISKTAAISASRSSSSELHRNLSSLIVERINIDGEDLKRIVYDEAIITVSKLTNDQLKILTLCFLVTRTKLNELTSVSEFNEYLEKFIRPFVDFKNTTAEFEHIVYAGCASVDIGSRNLENLLSDNYPDIFNLTNTTQQLLSDNETGIKLMTVWNDSKIQNMDLTSVGIVIASSFYEQITGDQLNINIWIN